MAEKQASLAEELKRAGLPPDQAVAADKFSWDDHGQGMISGFNTAEDAAITQNKEAIQRELDRLDKISGLRTNTVIPSLMDVSQAGKVSKYINEAPVERVTESVIPNGLYGRTVRVQQGSARTRVPGNINLTDPNEGFSHLTSVLGQMKYSTAATKRDILDRWTAAANRGERRSVVDHTSSVIMRDYAAAHGMDPKAAKAILDKMEGRRGAYWNALKTRYYSAAPEDGFVSMVDPEADEAIAVSKPLLQSQIENTHPILDPRLVDSTLKAGTQRRMLERWAASSRFGNVDLATKQANAVRGGLDMLDSYAQMVSSRWKDSALLRVAYPFRVQTDSQGRLAMHMGAMSTIANLPKRLGRLKLYYSEKDMEQALQSEFMTGETHGVDATGKAVSIDPGLNEDHAAHIARVIQSSGGGMMDLGNELANIDLRRFRGSNNWGKVGTADKAWFDNWVRDVQQIKASPTASQAMLTPDVDYMRAWARENAAGRQEWSEFSKQYRGDQEAWLADVVHHVNHYVPTDELKSAVIGPNGGFDQAAAKKAFDAAPDLKMDAHGEVYSPLSRTDRSGEWLNDKREKLYNLVADAPETVLARAPLYTAAYKDYMRKAIEATDSEFLDQKMLASIQRGAHLSARKEMAEVLYDSAHTSNLAHTMRFVSPFFAAWEDTMTKWSKLIYDNPSSMRRIMQAYQAPNDANFVVDSEGNQVDAEGHVYDNDGKRVDNQRDYRGSGQWIVVPLSLSGLAGNAAARKKAGQFKISKTSFNSVFQGDPWWAPGFGPAVQVPINTITRKMFPTEADSPIMRYLLPYGVTDDSPAKQFMPAWVRNARNAFGNSSDHANEWAQLMAVETIRFKQGDRKTAPTAEEIDNKTRNHFLMQAASDFGLPLKTQQAPKFQFYLDRWHEYQSKFGIHAKDKFRQDFPEYGDLAVSLSANDSGLNYTDKAYNAVKRYRSEIRENPTMAWFYAGADNVGGQFSNGVYNWERTTEAGKGVNFRGSKNPQQALDDIQVEDGWTKYNKMRTLVNLELKKRGLNNIQQTGADDLQFVMQKYRGILASQNKAWASSYGNGASDKVGELVRTASAAWAKDPKFKARSDQQALQQYLKMREVVRTVAEARGHGGVYAQGNEDVANAWDAYVKNLVDNNVGFEQMYNRALEDDDMGAILGGR